MDEWDRVQQKIKELEGSLFSANPEARSMPESFSVVDYRKRQAEEETLLWENKLAEKEKELEAFRQELAQSQQSARGLAGQLKEMETRMKTALAEGQARIKILESESEKKGGAWESKVKTLESENEELKKKIRKGIEFTETEAKRLQQTESAKSELEIGLKNVINKIQIADLEQESKIQQLEIDKQTALKRIRELQNTQREENEKRKSIEKELSLLNAERGRILTLLMETEREHFQAFESLARGFIHKVKNFIGVTRGTVQASAETYKMDEGFKNDLALVDEQAQSTLHFIEEFLSLVSVPEIKLQPVQIREWISQELPAVQEIADLKMVTLKKEFEENLPEVSIDPEVLSEGIRQLLLNAIEASQKESAVTVFLGFDADANKIVIKITDEGKGIPENHLKKMFRPYFTTQKGKKGLGLPIARRAVNLHRGSFSISSVENHGTTATVQIPC